MVPVPIPIGTDYTVVAAGSAPQIVLCEKCGMEYVYTAERAVQGTATNLPFMNASAARARAAQDAREALQFHLQYACDPVPCPACGWYQAAMVRRMRAGHLQWMFQLGILLCFVSPFLLIISLLATVVSFGAETPFRIFTGAMWVATLVALAAAPILFVLRSKKVRQFTPNDADVEARKKMGRRLAQSKDEYLTMLRDLQKKGIL